MALSRVRQNAPCCAIRRTTQEAMMPMTLPWIAPGMFDIEINATTKVSVRNIWVKKIN
jgi:hypothetical protein